MGEVFALTMQDAQPEYEPSFDDFWLLWPKERRIDRKNASIAWRSLKPQQQMDALLALVDWRQVWAARGEYEYVPHPKRWLRDERWTDELPPEYLRGKNTHVQVLQARAESQRISRERTPPPPEFTALLEKMRRKHG